MSESPQNGKTRLQPLRVAASVLAAAFGVQSRQNRERDFKEGKLATFVVAGILFTALFVTSVYLAVTLVLANAR